MSRMGLLASLWCKLYFTMTNPWRHGDSTAGGARWKFGFRDFVTEKSRSVSKNSLLREVHSLGCTTDLDDYSVDQKDRRQAGPRYSARSAVRLLMPQRHYLGDPEKLLKLKRRACPLVYYHIHCRIIFYEKSSEPGKIKCLFKTEKCLKVLCLFKTLS